MGLSQGILLLMILQSTSGLVQQFGAIARKAGGHIGAAVMLVETG